MSEAPLGPGDLIQTPGNYYKVIQHLGSGGMGAVYLAMDANLDAKVVVKVLHKHLALTRRDLVDYHEQEARAISKVKHPNIVRVTYVGRILDPSAAPFYVMDYLDGESLRKTLSRVKRLRPSRALHVIYQTLAGLMQMHEHGIVHCDLKPDNLILCLDGHAHHTVKIIDFGVIVLLASPPPPGFRGTYVYASPEQLSGTIPTPACDVWAAGMVLYELLAGVRPFAEYGDGREGALARVGKSVRSLRDFGLDEAHLDSFFTKALNPNPKERYQTAFEMWRAVGAIHTLYKNKDGSPNEITTDNRQNAPIIEPPRHITAAELAGPTHPDARALEWDQPIPFEPGASTAATRNEREAQHSTDRDPKPMSVIPSDEAAARRKLPTELPSAPVVKPLARSGPPPKYLDPAPTANGAQPAPRDAKTIETGPPKFDDPAPKQKSRPRDRYERQKAAAPMPVWLFVLIGAFVASVLVLGFAVYVKTRPVAASPPPLPAHTVTVYVTASQTAPSVAPSATITTSSSMHMPPTPLAHSGTTAGASTASLQPSIRRPGSGLDPVPTARSTTSLMK